MKIKLLIASDHGGFALKEDLIQTLASTCESITDLGVHENTSVNYPDFAHILCNNVLKEEHALGILVCGTGIGMSMAANRHKGIRAALCTDPYMARMARAHNDANVLCLGGRVIGLALAEEIAKTFLKSTFEGGRHAARVEKIDLS